MLLLKWYNNWCLMFNYALDTILIQGIKFEVCKLFRSFRICQILNDVNSSQSLIIYNY